MENFIETVKVGSNFYWDGAYKVYSSEDYTDAFEGTINGVDTRRLEIPCNKPWTLVACEVFDETYALSIAFFDGAEVHSYKYEERTYFRNTVSDICNDFIHDELDITPETISDIIAELDASLVYVDRESDEDECSDSDYSEDSDPDSSEDSDFDFSEDSDSDSSADLDIILDEDD